MKKKEKRKIKMVTTARRLVVKLRINVQIRAEKQRGSGTMTRGWASISGPCARCLLLVLLPVGFEYVLTAFCVCPTQQVPSSRGVKRMGYSVISLPFTKETRE